MRQPFQYLTRRRKNCSVDKDAAGEPPKLNATFEYQRFHSPKKQRGKHQPEITIVSGI